MTEDKTIVLYTFSDMLEATLAQDKLNDFAEQTRDSIVEGADCVTALALEAF